MCTTRFAASAFGIAPNNPPTVPHTCQQNRILNAVPGSTLTNPNDTVGTSVGGHNQFGINVTTAQLGVAGFTPFNPFGVSDGYHNGNVFFQVHDNGSGGLITQGHIDTFNPGGWPRSTPPPTLWVPHVSPLRHGTFAPQRSTPITVRTPPHAASTTSTLPSLPAETDCGCTPPRRCHPRNTLPGHPSVVPPQTDLPSPGQPHHPQPPAPATRPSRPDTAPPQLPGSPTQSSRLAASLSHSPLHLPITSALAPSKLQSPSTHPMERQSSHQGDRPGEKPDSHRYSAIILPLQHHPGEST